jgi:NADPH:quinone reductase-like Zn-dependent oxidoreductase
MPTVRRSTVIDAPVDAVWGVLRDFNGHAEWHPAIAASAIEGEARGDQVGSVRRFRLAQGGELREQLLWLSDCDRAFGYCILDAPLPLTDYVATMRVRPVTAEETSFCVWEGRFQAPVGEQARLAALVGDEIYAAGFEALKRHLRSSSPYAVPARVADSSTGAVVVSTFGGPDVLRWTEQPVSAPGPGEVRLRHTAIGVNFIDIYARSGLLRLLEPPSVPGMEAAGVVVAVGPNVTGITVDDRVGYACAPPGAYALERTMPAELLLRLPDELDDARAAAGLLKGMTAEFLLHRVHLVQEGEMVLVHAAAGGTGLLLCQWAATLGAAVIGTVSTPEKASIAREYGCAHPIVTTTDDFVASVQEITSGRGCDVIYDGIGADTFLRSYQALAGGGHLVSFGQAAGPIPPVDIAGFAAKSAIVSRPNFIHFTDTRQKREAIAARLFRALRSGALSIPEPRRFALREAAAAHRALESRATSGALVLIP